MAEQKQEQPKIIIPSRSYVGIIKTIKPIGMYEFKDILFNKFAITFEEYDGAFTISRAIKHSPLQVGTALSFDVEGIQIKPYNVL